MSSKRLKAVTLFIVLYIAVFFASVVACASFPTYRDGDIVPASHLYTAVKLSVDNSRTTTQESFVLRFDSPHDNISVISIAPLTDEVTMGDHILHLTAADGLTGTIFTSKIGVEDFTLTEGGWELRLTGRPDDIGLLSICSDQVVNGIVIVYSYVLPLTQGIYIAIAAYGLLLFFSKREQSLLMFSLYSLFMFLWSLFSFVIRTMQIDSPVTDLADSLVYWTAVAYSIATSVCFCKLSILDKYLKRWYVPLLAGAFFGAVSVNFPPFFDNLLVIAIYMVGGIVLLATFDEGKRLPRAVLYGLSISQGLRTVFLISPMLAMSLPIQFELLRRMHLLAMPYVVGCLVDIGGSFSRKFKRAELQAVELALINKELDERVEARTREVVRQQELRTSVLANLFHDCKTPLSIMQGSVSRMIDSRTFDLEQARIIERQVTYLTDIVDELFAVVKLQDNALLMDTEPVELALLAGDVSSSCSVEAASRNIQVNCSCSSNPIAWGDEMWLSRAFQNLVANAINFSEPGGVVEVLVSDDGKTAYVAITDHGAGIDPSEIDKVFDRYYRTAKDRTSHKSSGLGLAIAQGVIERHNGAIHVESEVGSGTTFTVELPLWAEGE